MSPEESGARYLANVWRVFGSSGSLQQAGGGGWGALLDQLPETGGEMSGSRVGGLAFFPQRQVELLRSPTGEERRSHQRTNTGVPICSPGPVYLARRDMAAVFAMFTTLDIGGILELVCTIPASRQPGAASSAAWRGKTS